MASSSTQSPAEPSSAIDHFSSLLTDHLVDILSRIPTKTAIGISVLGHRFRDLWKSTTSIDLDQDDLHLQDHEFIQVVNKLLDDRLAVPLHRFKINTQIRGAADSKALSEWLRYAHKLGLKDLNLDVAANTLERVFEVIASLDTLESLYLDSNCWLYVHTRGMVPQSITLPKLKTVHLKANLRDEELMSFVSKLPALESLFLEEFETFALFVSSLSLKRFKVTYVQNPAWYFRIRIPNLEYMEASFSFDNQTNLVIEDMPKIRKAVIHLTGNNGKGVHHLQDLFYSIMNVEELVLDIHELYSVHDLEFVDPIHELVDPVIELPVFPNLKMLNLSMCFHEDNIEDLMEFIDHCPSLQSVELVHLPVEFITNTDQLVTMDEFWASNLPKNSDGNRDHASFSDLHLDDNKSALLKLLANE